MITSPGYHEIKMRQSRKLTWLRFHTGVHVWTYDACATWCEHVGDCVKKEEMMETSEMWRERCTDSRASSISSSDLCTVKSTRERKKEGNKDLPDGRKLLPQKPREGRTMRAWSGVSCPIITRPWDPSLRLSNIAAPSNPIYVKIRTLKITIFGFS